MAKKKAKKSKAKEDAWKHEHVSGKAHPDNKPPLQIVAQASDEAAEKETQSIDAMRQKEVVPDWAALPGGKPADPSKPSAETPAPKQTAKPAAAKTSPAAVVGGGSAPAATSGEKK